MERIKPENAHVYSWDSFQLFADENGIGTEPGEWESWYECWTDGYYTCMFENFGKKI